MDAIIITSREICIESIISMSINISSIKEISTSSLLRRLWRGIGSTVFSQLISSVSSILLVSLFLRAWGSEGYGRWISLTAFISYLSLLDLGGQTYIGNLLASAYAHGDEQKFRATLTEGISLFLTIALAGFILLVGLLLLPGLSLPGQSVILPLEDRLVVLCLGINGLISIPGGVYVTMYRSTGRFTRGMMIGNLFRGGSLLIFISLLLFSVPPLVYAAASLASGIILTIFVIWDGQRIPINCGIRPSLAAALAGRVHLRGSLYFWLLAISNALNYQGVILVLTARLPASNVALYATHRTASGLISYVGNFLQGPLWPELTFLHAQERQQELARISLLVVKLIVFLSGAVALMLWFFLPVVYPIWTGKQLQIEPSLFAILLVQGVLAAGWNATAWVPLASNQHRRFAWWGLANAGLTIVLALGLVPVWGWNGVALATLTGDIVCGAAVYPFLAARSLNISVTKFYMAILRPVVALLLPGTALVGMLTWVSGWAGAGLGLLLGLVILYPTVLIAFGRKDLGWLMGKLKMVWNR